MPAELIPAVRRRVGAAPPVELRLDQFARRRRDAGPCCKAKGPRRRLFESETWKRDALQAISLRGADFLRVDLLPVDLVEMTARSCRTAAGENRRRLS